MPPEPVPTPGALTRLLLPGRRSDDRAGRGWTDTRTLLLDSVLAPVRRPTRTTVVLAAAVLLAELTGLVVRRACSGGGCGTWAARLDMDALGSAPRALITVVLAATALACCRAVLRAGRHGAAVWWSVLALGTAVLAAAKHTSVHSLVEQRLAGVLPGTDVQLLFVVVTVVGLLLTTVSGRWVRRETRTALTTWLGLYALASVGLAAVTVVLAGLGPVAADLSTWVEETGEGWAAVGLLAVVVTESRAVARRRDGHPPGGVSCARTGGPRCLDQVTLRR